MFIEQRSLDQKIAKENVQILPKSKPLANSSRANSRSLSRVQGRQLKPGSNPQKPSPNSNPQKPSPNNKPGSRKGGPTSKPGSLFGGKNKGEKCSSNQECFSTNCVFPGQQAGKQPKPIPKAKPNLYGSRSIISRANAKKPKVPPKPATKPVMGTCQAEVEQDPVPKSIFLYFA